MTDLLAYSPITLDATSTTPEVRMDFATSHLLIKGESYPENAAAFWRPILHTLDNWLREGASSRKPIELHVALTYFNSSSTKLLFEMFERCNQAALEGRMIILHWYHDEDDDISEDFGQELGVDFTAMTIMLHANLSLC